MKFVSKKKVRHAKFEEDVMSFSFLNYLFKKPK